jgi:hypothetical protein
MALEEYEHWSSHAFTAPRHHPDAYRVKYLRLKKNAVDRLNRVVKFPFGWLEDRHREDSSSSFYRGGNDDLAPEDAAARARELDAIKKTYFPVVVRMLCEVQSRECVVGAQQQQQQREESEGGRAEGRKKPMEPALVEKVENARGLWSLAGSFLLKKEPFEVSYHRLHQLYLGTRTFFHRL